FPVAVAKFALFLRLRHVRKVEGLTSFRQRNPRIPQAGIMFALFGIVCFLRQRCALGGRLPCGLALGSHLDPSIPTASPPSRPILRSPRNLRAGVSHFSLRKKRSRN